MKTEFYAEKTYTARKIFFRKKIEIFAKNQEFTLNIKNFHPENRKCLNF